MAYVTGTATSYSDFWDKLLDFLQNDTTLVSLEQNWELAWSAPVGAPNETDVVLKGPGLSGTDTIYIGLRLAASVPDDKFRILICGMTGVLPDAVAFDEHINCTPVNVSMFLDVGPMPYWFVATGRRFIAVARCSTVYEALYAGLALPYSTPSQYPYPLFVGGTATETSTAEDWRSTHDSHTMFYQPYSYYLHGPSQAWLLDPAGSWRAFGKHEGDEEDLTIGPDYFGEDSDYNLSVVWSSTIYGYRDIKDNIAAALGGDFPIGPFTLMQTDPAQTFGLLDGIFFVPGRGNAAENIITRDGVDYLVIQNTFRATTGAYAAIALEE